MNILVIGNGFDLAHGLPTKYTHFLEFCSKAKLIYTYREDADVKVYSSNALKDLNLNKELIEFLTQSFESRKCEKIPGENGTYTCNFTTNSKELDELNDCIKKNVWMDYFQECDMHGKENWIDFESEISDVIQAIQKIMEEKKVLLYDEIISDSDVDETNKKNKIYYEKYNCIRKKIVDYHKNEFGNKMTMKNLIDILLEDLNRLTRAFEIYLYIVSDKIEINKELSDISGLKIDHVLSFNYTHTYDKVYRKDKKEVEKISSECDTYIHGEVDINNTIETNNMVLGIDEYSDDEQKDKDITFIAFKKFYQRLLKGCDVKVKDWVSDIKQEAECSSYGRTFMVENEIALKLIDDDSIPTNRENFEKLLKIRLEEFNAKRIKHHIFIYGHSLDVTDKDILRDLILNDNVYTTIFYFSKDGIDKSDKGQKIANLTKVIGQDELIKRTAGSTKTIEFVQQK